MKIVFDNTEIAFKYKSRKDLKRAYNLFGLIGKPWVVKLGKIFVPFALKIRLPIQGIIKKTIFRQFCGGETMNECDEIINVLHQYKVGTILDYSVEGQVEEKEFDATKEELINVLIKAKGNKAIPFGVFKLTGLARFELLEKLNDPETPLNEAEKIEFSKIIERVDSICKTAHDNDIPLFIDAEQSWVQNTIDRITESMMAKYNHEKCIVYATCQMYRHDRLEYLRGNIEKAKRENYKFGVKLVRGAYMEIERVRASKMGYLSPIHADKLGVDKDFNAAIRLMMENIEHAAICCGTHNEESSQLFVDLIAEFKLPKNDPRLHFAQLLGMSDHISFNLSHHGYNVTKYVPYGPIEKVIPYLLRRAEENTSVSGQVGRELDLILREWKRRKKIRSLHEENVSSGAFE